MGGTSEIVNPDNGYLIDNNPKGNDVSEKIIKYYNLSSENKIKKDSLHTTLGKKNYNAEKNYTNSIEEILSL